MNVKEEREKALQWEVNNRTSFNRAIQRPGTVENVCMYNHDFNGGCAVGRLIPKELAARLSGIISRSHLKLLPDEVAELGLEFLEQLQSLHDVKANWDEIGLTAQGLVNAQENSRYLRLNNRLLKI